MLKRISVGTENSIDYWYIKLLANIDYLNINPCLFYSYAIIIMA